MLKTKKVVRTVAQGIIFLYPKRMFGCFLWENYLRAICIYHDIVHSVYRYPG